MDNVADLEKNGCNGCGICSMICPVKCIKMEEDGEGFFYPKVDKDKCIKCGKCLAKCSNSPEENKYSIKCYATKNKNENERMKSTSGGMFKILSKYTIENDGVVFGAKYNEKLEVIHSYATTIKGCEEFSNSKYVRSDLNNSYEKAKSFLDEGKIVLFTGTPCQVYGLKKSLDKEYDNLILCDIICHANPSPKVLKMFIKENENKEGKKAIKICFRNKTKELNGKAYIEFEDKSKVSAKKYIEAFTGEQLINRPSCNNCKFVSKNRKSDFTIGDYWGIENVHPKFYDNKGISILTVNSKKGEKIFELVKDDIDYIETSLEDGFKNNHHENIRPSKNREKFFKGIIEGRINESNIIEYMNKYTKKNYIYKIIKKIKKKMKLKR